MNIIYSSLHYSLHMQREPERILCITEKDNNEINDNNENYKQNSKQFKNKINRFISMKIK